MCSEIGECSSVYLTARNRVTLFACTFLLTIAFAATTLERPLVANADDIQIQSQSIPVRVSPGSSAPVIVKLFNFGGQSRIDVTVEYSLMQGDRKFSHEQETVAVETTASFVHNVRIPSKLPAGTYDVLVSVTYPGQGAPAFATTRVSVEDTFAGIFVSDLLRLAAALGAMALIATLSLLLARTHRHAVRTDYTHIPSDKRMYYEIVSDTIREMRLHKGDSALALAKSIGGLVVDDEGRVLALESDPASILAALVQAFEQKFGTKVGFALGTKKRALVR